MSTQQRNRELGRAMLVSHGMYSTDLSTNTLPSSINSRHMKYIKDEEIVVDYAKKHQFGKQWPRLWSLT